MSTVIVMSAGPLHPSMAVASSNGRVSLQSETKSSGKKSQLGGVVSTMVMVWTCVAALPQSSVAVNVRSMMYDPGHSPGTSTRSSTMAMSAASEQLSVAVGSGNTSSPHSTVTSAGKPTNSGATSSTRVMNWMNVSTFPQASVAVYTRANCPTGSTHPPAVSLVSQVKSKSPYAWLAVMYDVDSS